MLISHVLKQQYPSKIWCRNLSSTDDVGLRSARSYTDESMEKYGEMNASYVYLPSKEFELAYYMCCS